MARSINAQRPEFGHVSDEEVVDILQSEDYQARLREFRFSLGDGSIPDINNLRPGLSPEESKEATQNLTIDQAGLLLAILGERRQVEDLQLGVIVDKGPTFEVFPSAGNHTIWIHNDNASADGGPLNHFSGVELGDPSTISTVGTRYVG